VQWLRDGPAQLASITIRFDAASPELCVWLVMRWCSLTLGDGASLLGLSSAGGLLILGSDLLEVLVVLLEVGMLLKSDEKLGLLCLTVSLTLHGDGLGLDLLELSVLVSIQQKIFIRTCLSKQLIKPLNTWSDVSLRQLNMSPQMI
jgi:hypothetical protein